MRTESVSAPVAPVTGADKSIGLETARRLAGAGYRVYLTARSSERGRAAAATAGVRFLELGVTSDESVRHAAGCVERAGGTWTCSLMTPGSPARCVTTRTTSPPAA
jgi:NAD(P)-dependent dehydrogenase (short-subunit alcohol dehydrogenase family)